MRGKGKDVICLFYLFIFIACNAFIIRRSLKDIISQTDLYLVNLSSKTFVFEDKMTKY